MYIKPLSAIIESHSIIHHSFTDDIQLQMSAIIESHSIIHHSFADDIQLQMSAPYNISELLHPMRSCINDVKARETVNILKLNATIHNTCLSPAEKLSISKTYLLQLLLVMLNSLQSVCEQFRFYIRLSSYYERTCLQYYTDMLP